MAPAIAEAMEPNLQMAQKRETLRCLGKQITWQPEDGFNLVRTEPPAGRWGLRDCQQPLAALWSIKSVTREGDSIWR